MERTIKLFGGPFNGVTGSLRRTEGKFDRELGIYVESKKQLARYVARTNRKFVFVGFGDVPTSEPVVQIDVGSEGVRYSDPLGRNDYTDLPKPPADCKDILAFVRDLFVGGRVHLVAGK